MLAVQKWSLLGQEGEKTFRLIPRKTLFYLVRDTVSLDHKHVPR